jgi:hypothetical protein
VDARSRLTPGRHDPRWDDLLDALLKLIARHPDWRDELVATLEAANKKDARSR